MAIEVAPVTANVLAIVTGPTTEVFPVTAKNPPICVLFATLSPNPDPDAVIIPFEMSWPELIKPKVVFWK